MVDAVCGVVVETAVVVVYFVCNPGIIYSDQGSDVLFWVVLGYVYDETFINFRYVPMGRDSVFYVCDIEVVVFDVALFDEVVCYSSDIVAVVDVCKFIYLGQTFFAKGVDDDSVPVFSSSGNVFYQGAEVEEVVMSF